MTPITRRPSAFLFLLACCLAFTVPAVAQYRRPAVRQSQNNTDQSFTVAVAPLSLLLHSGKFNVRGEWAYADNKSISVIVGLPRPTKVPGSLANQIDVADDNSDLITNRYTSYGVIIENRFYLGHRAPGGLYFAPYARYNHFGITRTSKNPEGSGQTVIKGGIGGLGLGGAVGAQVKLGDHFTLDATFIGLDFKVLRGTLRYATTDPNNDIAAFRDKVQETVKDIPIIGSRLAAQIEGDEVKVHTPRVLLPGYRFNLTVGYTF
ncbi:MAG: hypothetical protein ABIQ93_15815 [Saprospiraceae bacterium]